ncbi:hypothetical protein LTR91_011274 [Friedmanniomyces endolithicus]|uniref:Zn(2)-C6 fungal-type domain-containing protein n=2 Tax=Friedmanniomyces endolithicus TaxID=329885 RepID=A0AAN6KHU7_9PEZI|nr:hypothetical protein LTS00_005666 [Friedmanniomyces endolithicus]KAK0305595.1 hypothetical protein LTR01_006742 [Friedmanniomyces endolithicus]KAK0983331.1 hypothetical protein LTR91_011274 [Friedmanniomyces endolithicus]KAK1029706.1 hypothetical protein LTS16_019480 [Friedmanniomyces endolithicus]
MASMNPRKPSPDAPRPRASLPRHKAFARRSMSGCYVCRIRHLKCDERKPACLRCLNSAWECQSPGQRADSRRSESLVARATTPSSLQWRADSNLSFAEDRALHYFTQHVASDLFGFLVSDFWTYTVSQRCYSTPLVRSAVLALSSTHIDFTIILPPPEHFATSGPVHGIESLQLYHAAIADLRVYLSQTQTPSRTDVLISCAALICCDLLRGEQTRATQHVDHGAAVVRAWQQGSIDSQYDEEVVKVFYALDLHATSYDGTRLPALGLCPEDGGKVAEIPAKFSSLREAQRHLVLLQNAAFVHLNHVAPYKMQPSSTVPRHLLSRRRAMRASFQGWSIAMTGFEEQRQQGTHTVGLVDSKEQAALLALKIQHQAFRVLLDESIREGEYFQDFVDDGDQILQWAEQALTALQTLAAPSRLPFSIDLGLSTPLYLLVEKTSDAPIRQRGITLLARVQKLGGWHRPQAMLQTFSESTAWQNMDPQAVDLEEVLRPH